MLKSLILDGLDEIRDRILVGQSLSGVYDNDYLSYGANPVQSSSYQMIRKAFELSSGFGCVVDVGCGMGRFLFQMERLGYKGQLIGVEIDPTYAAFCELKARRYKNITILNIDALSYSIDKDAMVYMYNPFKENLARAFIDKLEAKRIFYTNAVLESCFVPKYKVTQRLNIPLNDGTPVPCLVLDKA
ncbi:MAG: class I SAM-dependent methyltransferase [Sphaerochaetaceae bacterium]|jgi:SAM-dependent methyltransferase|nr:class I SAM-dependent methyltransferase [Sphaerochaetaceae bacterium]